MVQVPAAVLSTWLPAKVTGQAVAPTWEMQMEFVAPSFSLTLVAIWEVNQHVEALSLSSITALQINACILKKDTAILSSVEFIPEH